MESLYSYIYSLNSHHDPWEEGIKCHFHFVAKGIGVLPQFITFLSLASVFSSCEWGQSIPTDLVGPQSTQKMTHEDSVCGLAPQTWTEIPSGSVLPFLGEVWSPRYLQLLSGYTQHKGHIFLITLHLRVPLFTQQGKWSWRCISVGGVLV